MAQTHRIDLTELGEGHHVIIRDPKTLSWGRQKRLALALKTDNPDLDSQVEFLEELSVELIKQGYILDEDDAPVAFPLNSDSVQKLPTPVLQAVAQKYGELRKEAQANPVPNA